MGLFGGMKQRWNDGSLMNGLQAAGAIAHGDYGTAAQIQALRRRTLQQSEEAPARKARDEAGNIWETDFVGRPIRLLQASGYPGRADAPSPDIWQQTASASPLATTPVSRSDIRGPQTALLDAIGASPEQGKEEPDGTTTVPSAASGIDLFGVDPGSIGQRPAATAYPYAIDAPPNAVNHGPQDAERAFRTTVLGLDPRAIARDEWLTRPQIYFPALENEPERADPSARHGNMRSASPARQATRPERRSVNHRQQQPASGQPTGARVPEMRGGLPIGTEIEWDIDQPERAWSRNQHLIDHYGLPRGVNDEATIVAFWNANRGNANLTPQAVKDWYVRQGLPVPSNDEEVSEKIEHAKAGGSFQGYDTSMAEQDYFRRLDQALEQRGAHPESVPGAIGINAAQGIMWGSLDEAAGVRGTAGAAIDGGDPIAAYRFERDLLRREQQRASDARPWLSGASELGGSVLTGGWGFRTPARAAMLARQARAFGNPVRAQMLDRVAARGAMSAGAAMGAVSGFNHGEGLGDSLGDGAIGGVTGGLGGYAGQKAGDVLARGANALRPTSRLTPDEVREAIALGAEHRVPILTSDLFEPTTPYGKFIQTASEQNPLGGSVADRMTQQVKRIGAVKRLTPELGNKSSADLVAEATDTSIGSPRWLYRMLGSRKTTPEEAARLLFSHKPAEIQRLAKRLSPEGRIKAQGAIMLRAIENAGGIDNLNPDEFVNQIAHLGESVGVMFADRDLARLRGLQRLLQITKRAGVATALPLTDQLLTRRSEFVASAALGVKAIPFYAGAGALSRAYESPKVRDLLVGLSRTPRGSRSEGRLIERITMVLGSQAPMHAEGLAAAAGPPTQPAAASRPQQ